MYRCKALPNVKENATASFKCYSLISTSDKRRKYCVITISQLRGISIS